MNGREVTRIDSLNPATDDCQYYGRIQHDSSPRIPGSAYTVLNCRVVGRGQFVA
jgi:hypothetical protein